MHDGEMTLGLPVVEIKPAEERTAGLSEDAGLFAAICTGDEQAFTRMHRKFAPLVHGVLMARMPADEVADVVQEVFIAAYKGIGSLRDPDALGPWLVKLARNHALDKLANCMEMIMKLMYFTVQKEFGASSELPNL